jgi:putative ABC transport system substrate-binding protein
VLLASLVLVACIAPLAVEAQQAAKVWHIGYLSTRESRDPMDDAFDPAMKQLGYVEGQNLAMERRFLRTRLHALDDAVQEVMRLNVDVIVTWAIRLSAAAKRATNTIPVVFLAV